MRPGILRVLEQFRYISKNKNLGFNAFSPQETHTNLNPERYERLFSNKRMAGTF